MPAKLNGAFFPCYPLASRLGQEEAAPVSGDHLP